MPSCEWRAFDLSGFIDFFASSRRFLWTVFLEIGKSENDFKTSKIYFFAASNCFTGGLNV